MMKDHQVAFCLNRITTPGRTATCPKQPSYNAHPPKDLGPTLQQLILLLAHFHLVFPCPKLALCLAATCSHFMYCMEQISGAAFSSSGYLNRTRYSSLTSPLRWGLFSSHGQVDAMTDRGNTLHTACCHLHPACAVEL